MLALVLVALLAAPAAFADPLAHTGPSEGLTYPKKDGIVRVEFSFRSSDEFFAEGGGRRASSDPSYPFRPSGATSYQEHSYDFTTVLSLAYGLADDLTLWLDFPIVYRAEVDAYDGSDWGIGDLAGAARYRFLNLPGIETAFEIGGTFPSGSTAIGFSDPTQGVSDKMPLGAGVLDVVPGLLAKWRPAKPFALTVRAAYAFRIGSLVEYLQGPTIPQSSPDGTQTANLPTGNLRIDWGNEVRAGLGAGWDIQRRLTLLVRANYLWRAETPVDTFEFDTTGGTLNDSQPVRVSLAPAQRLSVEPSLSFRLTKSMSLRVSAEVPLWGDAYPTLPLVEPLVGTRYALEIRHDF